MNIAIVAATPYSEDTFWSSSPLGQSLDRLGLRNESCTEIAFANLEGLPDFYNRHLSETTTADAVVFLHDDVWLDDFFLITRVLEGLQHYDVIGVAGNRRRLPRQPSWAFIDTQFNWDDPEHLSGTVAMGDYPFGQLSVFGHCPADCELLDGVLLAVKSASIMPTSVRFDPAFPFHFYDLDFCRQARNAGLRLGTWPIAITHQSGGSFGSTAWNESYNRYL